MLSTIMHLDMLKNNVFFINICMLNLKFDVFIHIINDMLFVKSNKNYHLQAKKIYVAYN